MGKIFLIISMLTAAAQAQMPFQLTMAPGELDFLVGHWEGREICRSGGYVVQVDVCAQQDGTLAATYSSKPQLPRGSGSAGSATIASGGSPGLYAFRANMMGSAGVLGTVKYAAQKRSGSFQTGKMEAGNKQVASPVSANGSGNVKSNLQEISFTLSAQDPGGRDSCSGKLYKTSSSCGQQ